MDLYTNRMRSDPIFRSAEFVWIVEKNLSQVKSNDICNWVQSRYQPCSLLCDDPKHVGSPGVWVRDGDKDRFINNVNSFLKSDSLLVYENFHTSRGTGDQLLPALQAQLNHFRRHLKPCTDASLQEERKYVWSGKDKSGNMKDDMAMCLMQGLWHAVGFMADRNMTHPYPAVFMKQVNYNELNRVYAKGRVVV